VNDDRRTLWMLGAVLFISYAYFYQAGGWNQNSRFALVRALLERHTLRIDAYQLHTGDRAVWEGHYYSDKAPGQSLAALVPAAAARAIARVAGVDPTGFGGLAWISYVSAVSTAGFFTVIAALGVFVITRQWGYSRGAALFASTGYGLASPAFCYATLFMAHGMTAGCLIVAFGLAWAPLHRESGTAAAGRRAGACALFAGWAVVCEFQAAIPAAAIVAVAVARAWRVPAAPLRTVLVRTLLSGAACAGVLLAYNTAAFGNPLHLGYQSEEGFEHLRRGLFGITTPEWWRLRELLIGRYRGLLPLAPLMAAAPLGLIVAGREPDRRGPAALAGFIALYYLLLNASYYYWEGGWAYGPRQIMSGLPFLALGLGPIWDARVTLLRPLLLALWVWGAGATLVAEATNPQPPSSFRAPFSELLWPAFVDGDFSLNTQTMVHSSPPGEPRPGRVPRAAWNLGEVAGLHGHASLAPLYGIWIAGAILLLRRPAR
jgi:hypothetical protein